MQSDSTQVKDLEGEDAGNLSQPDYIPTPFEDASWEVVGERLNLEVFEPLGLEVIPLTGQVVDPMFHDYGGIGPEDNALRWHLPEHLAFKDPLMELKKAELENEEEKSTRITEEEIEKIKAAARAEGRQEILNTVAQENKIQQQNLEERVISVLSDLTSQMNEHLNLIERESVKLSLDIAHRIIGTAVEVNPEYIIPILHDAIGKCGTSAIRKVKVSPADLEFIEIVRVHERFKEYDGTWKFEADDTIKNGCVVETSSGDIDYRLDEAWERIAGNVLKATSGV